MVNEKKIWLCEQYAQKAWALSLNLMQEAARAGKNGRGYAVIADETRKLVDNLFAYTEKMRFDSGNENEFKGIADLALEIGFLAVNTALEIIHVEAADDKSNNKSIAVCADEVRKLAFALSELAGKRIWQNAYVFPEVVSPLRSTSKTDFFFRFSIGGTTLVENALNVQEVFYRLKADTAGEKLSLRGFEIPVIDCSRRFNLSCAGLDADRQTFIIINPNYEKNHGNGDDFFAVLADDLDVNALFRSKIACAVPPKGNDAFSEYAQECWDVLGGEQLVFVDWEKLAHR